MNRGQAIYNNSSYIIGEAVMESKINNYYIKYNRQYNLYGDPALNLFPYGYTVPQNLTWSGTVDITTDITIPSGVTLFINPGTLIRFRGYYTICVQSGGRINAQGISTSRVVFTSGIGQNPNSWKYVELQGGNNIFKYCTFEYGYYSLYLNNASATPVNSLENCIFRNNSFYGIKLYNSKANIKDCEMTGNGYYGAQCQSNPEIKFTGNWIHHNTKHGIYSFTSNLLKFYGNVIEKNGLGGASYNGLQTINADVVKLGIPYSWSGKNTIRRNSGTELYAASGGSDVDINFCSIHDSIGTEVNNFGGNPTIDAQSCYWDVNGCQYSGSVNLISPNNSLPAWDGQRFDDYSIPKVSANEDGPPEDIPLKIKQIKELIANKPETTEAENALSDFYSIVRTDYVEDKLEQRKTFYDFLSDVYGRHKTSKIGKKALKFMIIWEMLEQNFVKFIQLSNVALKELDESDRMYVLAGMGFVYSHAGKFDQADQCLKELKQKYLDNEEMSEVLAEDIEDMKWQVEKGFIQPLAESDLNIQKMGVPDNAPIFEFNNFPNPGNPSTTLRFNLPESRYVKLKVYNLLGQQVRTLINERKDSGAYSYVWDGKDRHGNVVPSGIYLFILDTEDKVISKKFTLIK